MFVFLIVSIIIDKTLIFSSYALILLKISRYISLMPIILKILLCDIKKYNRDIWLKVVFLFFIFVVNFVVTKERIFFSI